MSARSPLTREKLSEIARTLPTAPRVLTGLADLLRDTNASLDAIAELIKRDTALAARVIRVSNSIYYASGALRTSSVEEAVNRVGLTEIYRLVALVSADRLTERPLRFYGIECHPLRENMIYTALATEMLANEVGYDPRAAYSAGLLRPLGLLVLDRVAELLAHSVPYDHGKYGVYRVWEGQHFGFSNPDVAALILQDWSFPPEIVAAIRDHYLIQREDYADRLACLLNLAGLIVADAGHTLPGDRRHWEYDVRKLEAAGITDDQVRRAGEQAQTLFERLRTTLA